MSRTADFSKVCVDCENHTLEGKFHQCSAQRCLITGRTIVVSCGSRRSKAGCCGPDGLRYTKREVVIGGSAGGASNSGVSRGGGGGVSHRGVKVTRVGSAKTPERV